MLTVWPEHCLVGSPGHAVVPTLASALQEWCVVANRRQQQQQQQYQQQHRQSQGKKEQQQPRQLESKEVAYIKKGLNNLTEMYSAIAADVPLDSDPSTQVNLPFVAALNRSNKLVICGQALSHCVNFTMRDILRLWEGGSGSGRDGDGDPAGLVLLTDCCSPVPGFESVAAEFLADMRAAGCQLSTASQFRI